MRRTGALVFWAGVGMVLGCTGPDARPGALPPRRAGMDDDAFAASAAEKKLPELSDKSGLNDHLTYAALNNAALEAAFERWKAALARIPQVRALPDPRFTYKYFIEEVETRVGAQRQAFELAQTFPWFGKLALRGDVAAAAAETARRHYETARLALFYKVRDAWYEYYYLKHAIAITKENVQLLKHIESVVRIRYKAAAAGHPDVIRAQVELGKLADRLAALTDLRGPIVAKLNAALNRPAETPLPWPPDLAEPQVAVTDGQLLAWMAQSNPELKALDSEISRNGHRIELAKKDYFPDVTVGLSYVDTAGATGTMRPDESGDDPLIAMVSVNLPIWRRKLDAGLREARLRRLAAVAEKQEKTNSLGAALKLAAYRFRDAERKLDLYRDTLLPKATESLKATEASFRAGKANFTDLIDAQRILLEFALAQQRALADKAQHLAKLEMLVGKRIPRKGNANTPKTVQKDENPDK